MLESKRKAIIFFIIALILALLTGFLVLQKVQALNSNLGTMVKVYVASGDISSRTVITPDDISTDEVPKKYLRDEHVTNVDDLINKVSIVPLSAGDIITTSMLKQASAVTKADNRLITIMESERVSFDEKLTALDRVDLIVSQSFEGEPVTEVFMTDVKVARTAKDKDGNDFAGVQLEIPFDQVPDLIHMQNYADSLRIVKSNVGQLQETEGEESEEEAKKEEEKQKQEEQAKKEAEKKKQEEQAKKEAEKKKQEEEAKKEEKKDE